jgi:hypothetical protein
VPFARTKGVGELLSASTEVRAATVDATESIPLAWGDRFAGRREGPDGLGGDCDSARLDWLAALESVASTVDGFSLNPGFGLAERASRWMTSPFFEPDSTGRIDGVGAVVATFRWTPVGSETRLPAVSDGLFAEAFSINCELGLAERASRWMTSPFCEPDSTGRIDGVGAVVTTFRWTPVGSETRLPAVSDGLFAEAFSINCELGLAERASRWNNAPFCEPDSTGRIDGVGAVVATFRWTPVGSEARFATVSDGLFAEVFSINCELGLAERASRWIISPFCEPDSTGRIDGVGAVVATFRWTRVGSETPFWTVSSRVFAEGSAPLVSEVRAIVDGVGSTEDRPVAKGEPGFCFEALSLKRPPNEGAKSVVKLGRAPVPGSRMRLRNASLLLAGRTDTPATGDVPRSCDCATARRAASRTSLEIKSMPIDGSEAVADRDVGND